LAEAEVLKLYLKKRLGLSDEEASTIAEYVTSGGEEASEFKNALLEAVGALGELAEKVKPLPPQAQATVIQHLAPVLARLPLQQKKSSSDLIEKLVVLREALGGGNSELVKKLDELAQLLKEMKQQPQQDVVEQTVKTLENLERLRELLDRLRGGNEEAKSVAEVVAEAIDKLREELKGIERRDPLTEIIEYRKKLEEALKVLEQLGFRVERGEPRKPLEEVIKELEAMGYEVKRRSLTPEEVEQMLKKREEEIRERLKRELEYDKAKMEQVASIIKTLIETVVGKLAEGAKEAYREVAREVLRQRLMQRAAQRAVAVAVAGGEGSGESGGGKQEGS
jgi:translation elongation factor EF-1beta